MGNSFRLIRFEQMSSFSMKWTTQSPTIWLLYFCLVKRCLHTGHNAQFLLFVNIQMRRMFHFNKKKTEFLFNRDKKILIIILNITSSILKAPSH